MKSIWMLIAAQPETIKVALIGAVTVVLSILGSIITVQWTNISNARQQRAAEVRRIKQQYYTGFFEAQWKKEAVVRATPEDKQAIMEASRNFGLEFARLPMYASQAFVESVHSALKGEEPMTPAQFYELMREDLSRDDYTPFRNLKFDTFWYPDTGVKGQQQGGGYSPPAARSSTPTP